MLCKPSGREKELSRRFNHRIRRLTIGSAVIYQMDEYICHMTTQTFNLINNQNLFLSRRMKWIIQIVYWSVHLGLQIGLYATIDEDSGVKVLLWALLTGSSTLLIFYSYFYGIIPRFLGKSNLKFLLITIGFILLYPTCKYLLDKQLGLNSLSTIQLDIEQEKSEAYYLGLELGRRLVTLIWNIPFALFARFMVDWFKNMRIKSQMETQQLKSELALLRNQVNPHFLFNVLNNIDTMVYPYSEEASAAIMKLSAIMRYMLYESDTDFVNIEKEVNYLKSFVDLQKMRLKPTDKISFNVASPIPEITIAPMILIPFVENAFKHASRINDRLHIDIHLSFDDDKIQMKVVNSFDPSLEEQKDHTGGIGLNNVKKRLELIYPSRHLLTIDAQKDEYLVNLEIKSDKK